MPSASFHLKDPKSDKPTAIFILFNADGKRTKIYTGYTIHKDEWDKDEQKARIRRHDPGNGTLNLGLKRMADVLNTYYAEARSRGVLPRTEDLRAAIEPQEEVQEKKPLLLPDFAAYVSRLVATRRPATAKSAKTTCNHLAAYQRQTRKPLEYESLNMSFYDGFTSYLLNVAKLTDNSLSKQISILKRFLADAVVRGHTERQDFKRWSWVRREPDTITLTHQELLAIERLELPTKHYLDNARGLFLLSCYTALRFSDVAELQPINDKGDRLRVTTQKTSDTLTIPVSPKARVILDRMWKGELHPITNQKMNLYLKELAKLAGIDTEIETNTYRAGDRLAKRTPKHDLISSHTGRRTFVTLALEDGIPWEVIMKVTGHKDMKSFRRYINVSEERHLDVFNRMWASKKA